MWYALDVVCEAGAAEAVRYGLMEAGAAGVEETATASAGGLIGVVCYFAEMPDRELVRGSLAEALRIYGLDAGAVREAEWREVAEYDWLAAWKASWQPIEVGSRFLIAPPWSEVQTQDRTVIRIEPGMAFGTGTHETTRLCLLAIETYFRANSFLDVGTGTGILAIAAAKLAPAARVEACDTDPDAIAIARENARLNGVGERIRFWVGTVEESTTSASCVCANLTADVILPLLPALIGASCERLILSGILSAQAGAVTARLRELGIHNHEIKTDGEWVSITCY